MKITFQHANGETVDYRALGVIGGRCNAMLEAANIPFSQLHKKAELAERLIIWKPLYSKMNQENTF